MREGTKRQPGPARDRFIGWPTASLWWIGVSALVIGIIVGIGTALQWTAVLNGARFGAFVKEFLTSAGLGGLATIVAAGLAVSGVSRQLRQSSEDGVASREREIEESQTADWWKSFEWTTARIFPAGEDETRKIDDNLAYSLATALKSRARTEEQRVTCDALVNQISTIPPIETSTKDEASAMHALGSYIRQVERSGSTEADDRRNLVAARSRLLTLQLIVALRTLADEGLVDEVQKGDSRDLDASFDSEGLRYGVEARFTNNIKFVLSVIRRHSRFPLKNVHSTLLVIQSPEEPSRTAADRLAAAGISFVHVTTDASKVFDELLIGLREAIPRLPKTEISDRAQVQGPSSEPV
ncbi:hypothetical protein [Curtobacterium sp. 1544]|uniref:hypothetical protein n=1 Tax=Curtobacterium sp. 1544 TaxID=3156417 RepID=UPI003392A6D8